MAKNKTTETTANVDEFLETVADQAKRSDSYKIMEIMKDQTGFEPKMWGPAIIGFGSYHYKYESGREGDAPLTGFSPRSNAISLYMLCDTGTREELLKQFGKYKAGKGCIYIKRLDDININILRQLIDHSVSCIRKKYQSE